MIDSLSTLTSGVPEMSVAPAPAATAVSPLTEAAAQRATRLLVEPNGAQGYVYRLVDATTGRLLAEAPRECLDDLKTSPDYAAGALISTSA